MKTCLSLLLLVLSVCAHAKVRVVAITSGGLQKIAAASTTSNINFQLPAHTIGLIYMVSTYGNTHSPVVNRPLNLLAQVSRLLSAGVKDPQEIAAQSVPASMAALVDAYFFEDRSNGNTALSGVNTGYSLPESRLQFNGGAVGITMAASANPSLRLLGIKNLSEETDIRVLVEAVALVDDGMK